VKALSGGAQIKYLRYLNPRTVNAGLSVADIEPNRDSRHGFIVQVLIAKRRPLADVRPARPHVHGI
jgi:hypothetical protein